MFCLMELYTMMPTTKQLISFPFCLEILSFNVLVCYDQGILRVDLCILTFFYALFDGQRPVRCPQGHLLGISDTPPAHYTVSRT